MNEDEKIERIVGAAEPVVVHARWRDLLDYVLVTAVVLLAVSVVALAFFVDSAKSKADHDDHRVDGLSSALDSANQRIISLGGTPVKTPTSSPPVSPASISDSQILEGVARYFADHPVTSPSIDYSKLHAYVIEYVAAHPAPSGKPGPSGPAGPSGSAGSPPSAEQLSTAVSEYFAANPPQPGPQGPPGPSGSSVTGSPGRGIVSVDCSGAGAKSIKFTVTYSDGTSQEVACTEPTPSPTPSLTLLPTN